MKNVAFIVLFGSLFGVALWGLDSSTEDQTFGFWGWIAFSISAFTVLRITAILSQKAYKLGKGDDRPVTEENYFQMLLGLPFVGEYLTTALALLPVVPVLLLVSPDFDQGTQTAAFFGISSIVGAAWLFGLEKLAGVAITFPIVPVRVIWLMPVFLVVAISSLF